MTYITYTKMQYSNYKKESSRIWVALDENRRPYKRSRREAAYKYTQPPKKIPSTLPKPDFMPSFLVRTSDMKLVEGSKVQEGYCTLSYSWNQSGETIKNETTGKSYRIDQGKHKIVYPGKTVRKKPRGRKRIPRKVRFVTFEELIQEICKDFNIKYIWYDQMCINQNNKEEKLREIRQMHKIYSNAYCAVALVPEEEVLVSYKSSHTDQHYTIDDMENRVETSQWMKRMWTLEEAVMSSRVLFLGRNTHFWWYDFDKTEYPIFYKRLNWGVHNILYYAHARTSTKKHDHIFALANIFPDVMKKINIDYNQDVQKLAIKFYGLLAKKDLRILYFGSYENYETMCKTSPSNSTKNSSSTRKDAAEYDIPVQKFDLPSWTGVYGEHYVNIDYKTSFKNYTVSGRVLKITCGGLTNDLEHTKIRALGSITRKDIPAVPQIQKDNDTNWQLVSRVRPTGSANDKLISHYILPSEGHRILHDPESHPIYSAEDVFSRFHSDIMVSLQNFLHFMPIKKTTLQWIPFQSEHEENSISPVMFRFDYLVEPLQDSSQYVLLTEVQFKNTNKNFYPEYAVIKKDGDYYKAIGMCRIQGDDSHFFDDFTLEKQTVEIH